MIKRIAALQIVHGETACRERYLVRIFSWKKVRGRVVRW
jgi:hypothetical protein